MLISIYEYKEKIKAGWVDSSELLLDFRVPFNNAGKLSQNLCFPGNVETRASKKKKKKKKCANLVTRQPRLNSFDQILVE